MGAVKTTLSLNDGMTPALRRITYALGVMQKSFDAVQRASGRSIDTQAMQSMKKAASVVNDTLNSMEQNYQAINEQQCNFNKGLGTGASNAEKLFNRIKGIAATYIGMQSISKLTGLSDELTSQRARLELIVDGGGSVAELEQKIFASAQRARAGFTDTMATVAKLGQVAGNAFSNNDQLVKFSELVNKNFVVGGASATEQASAMYQLTQAMGSGRLQGDEYRSIIENAPLLAKSIENYMRNVQGAKGSMKEWAAEGLLTAGVIKAAVFSSADEVEERFNKMPKTWAQIWTSMKNEAVIALDPVLQKINELANDTQAQNTIKGLLGGFAFLTKTLLGVFGLAVGIYNFFANNWSIIAPVVYGIATAFAAYNAALLTHKALLLGSAVADGMRAVAAYQSNTAILQGVGLSWQAVSGMSAEAIAAKLVAAGYTEDAAATAAATMAQTGFNTALLACPITWIIVAIIAVIALVYGVVAAVNKATGATTSATGIIFGAICTVAAAIWNTVIGVINAIIQYLWTSFVEPWISIIEWVLNVFNGGFNSFGDAVANLLGNIISWFLSLGKVVTKIIDAIFGTNWTAGLSSLQDKVLAWGKNENSITLSREAPTIQSMTGGAVDRWSYSNAWNTGYMAGERVDNTISNLFNIDKLTKGANIPTADQFNGLNDIADDTASLAENSDKTTEELSYLRDIAEKEAINRFTTAEIKVDMTGMTNRIDSDMDIDGVISYFTESVEDALLSAAEGISLY